MSDVDDVAEVGPCFLDTEPEIYPMQCPGTQCLFCLGDDKLAADTRTRCFAKPLTLRRHVHTQHLKYLPEGKSFTCPHPACSLQSVQLTNHSHFKSHALQDHNIVHTI